MLCGFISTAPLAAEMRELIETCIDAPLFDIYGHSGARTQGRYTEIVDLFTASRNL